MFSQLNQYHITSSWYINNINMSKWGSIKNYNVYIKIKRTLFQSCLWCVMLGSQISVHKLGVVSEV